MSCVHFLLTGERRIQWINACTLVAAATASTGVEIIRWGGEETEKTLSFSSVFFRNRNQNLRSRRNFWSFLSMQIPLQFGNDLNEKQAVKILSGSLPSYQLTFFAKKVFFIRWQRIYGIKKLKLNQWVKPNRHHHLNSSSSFHSWTLKRNSEKVERWNRKFQSLSNPN